MAKLEKIRIPTCSADQPFLNKCPGDSVIFVSPAPEPRETRGTFDLGAGVALTGFLLCW